MSAIFGIIGTYTDKDIENMKAALSHRGSSKPLIHEFKNGFIGSYPSIDPSLDQPDNRNQKGAVIDGYVDAKTRQNWNSQHSITIDDNTAGLYSIAIYDSQSETLDLFRDPSGARPLYFSSNEKRCIFASSPKAILTVEGVTRTLDHTAVFLYLSMICPPDPITIYQSIQMLRPGFQLHWHDGKTEIIRFYRQRNRPDNYSNEDAATDLRTALEQAVLDAIPPDHANTGFFLSGGTDTGAVVSLAAKAGISPINTFTIGYEGAGSGYESYNEFYYAKLIADHYKTVHHEFTISPDMVKQALPGIVAHLHQPSGDAINTYLVAGSLPSNIHTVLTGTGGDEVFIGSHWFKQLERLQLLTKRWLSAPSFLRTIILQSAKLIDTRSAHRIARLEALKAGVPAQYRHFKHLFSASDLQNLLQPSFLQPIDPDMTPDYLISIYDEPAANEDPINRLENLLFHHEVSNLQLRDVDSMSHAHGFESRSPLVDWRVVNMLRSVPGYIKAPEGKLRHLMFQALDDCLLMETRTRRKMSFIVPMDLWARRELRPAIEHLLSPEVVARRGILRPDTVEKEMDAFYLKGTERHPFKIWNMAMLELWCRFHLDAPIDASIPSSLDDLL